jgi:hypothetical protein
MVDLECGGILECGGLPPLWLRQKIRTPPQRVFAGHDPWPRPKRQQAAALQKKLELSFDYVIR